MILVAGRLSIIVNNKHGILVILTSWRYSAVWMLQHLADSTNQRAHFLIILYICSWFYRPSKKGTMKRRTHLSYVLPQSLQVAWRRASPSQFLFFKKKILVFFSKNKYLTRDFIFPQIPDNFPHGWLAQLNSIVKNLDYEHFARRWSPEHLRFMVLARSRSEK